ncbi:phosphotriesterase family protein [Psychrilyobacter atlanticus]|uniref:phosphotriesterase family protein n=1 Tax=Psychrilyobacter atlanticus TaxID=271091 RepID=UPI000415B447|nr:phosphotriesterase-related protein [Psychrilyobacter atlanticus]
MNYTMMHEHMFIDLSVIKKSDDCRLDCKEETIKELKELYKNGVRNIVEVTNIGIGRDIKYIQEVAKESGINILISTGYYKEPFLPKEVSTKTIEELAEKMIEEITIGIDGSEIKASIIGEIGTSKDKMTELEKKNFMASAIAHLKTGVPITTHTTLGTCGMEQVELFNKLGINLKKVIIGHLDLSGDEEYIELILKTGVNIEFDTIGKLSYLSDEIRADILTSLINKGWEEQIVLSMDITRKSHMQYLGGVGYNYLFDTFIPMLIERGVTKKSIEKLLRDNPNRILNI